MVKMFSAVAAIGLSCLICSTAMAQTSASADSASGSASAAPVAPTAPAAPEAAVTPAAPAAPVAAAVVPNGTPIVVEFTDLVTTRTAVRDDMFNLKLAEPVMLNNVVVIPAGTPGKGQVIDVGKPGMAGKPGKLVLAARYLELDGKQIPIRGLKMAAGGKSNTETAAVATIAVGIFGLAVTGGHMEVAPGTRAVAKLGVDFAPGAAAAPPPPPQTPAAAEPAATPPANP